MKNILYVESSVKGEHGHSSQQAQLLLNRFKSQYSELKITTRTLSDMPHYDANTMAAFFSPAESLNAEQQELINFSDQLVAEIKQADIIIITAPMYNFSIPSQLKSYFDQLARVGVTFQYTEQGPVGLLQDTPVYVLATRGGQYEAAGIDFQMPFIKQFLNFLGLQNVQSIISEGLSSPDHVEQVLQQSADKINALAL